MCLSALAVADPAVKVLNGSYSGLYLPTFNQDLFLGIPYAMSTTGQNRFRIPQSLNETWHGLRDAKQYSQACPDQDPADELYGMGEDCLSINVVRPAGCEDVTLPVVVWIHGGRFATMIFSYYILPKTRISNFHVDEL